MVDGTVFHQCESGTRPCRNSVLCRTVSAPWRLRILLANWIGHAKQRTTVPRMPLVSQRVARSADASISGLQSRALGRHVCLDGMAPPRELPGFVYDPVTDRYYKQQSSAAADARLSSGRRGAGPPSYCTLKQLNPCLLPCGPRYATAGCCRGAGGHQAAAARPQAAAGGSCARRQPVGRASPLVRAPLARAARGARPE